jgi:hypothetical protein
MIIVRLIPAALFYYYIVIQVKAGISNLFCQHHKFHDNSRNDEELNLHAVVYHGYLRYDDALRMLNRIILCSKPKLIVNSSSIPSYLIFT